MIIAVITLLFLHFYVPRFITEIRNPIVKVISRKSTKKTVNFKNNEKNGKFLRFQSFDAIELSVYLTYSKLDSVKGTIILLHGIRSNKESYVEMAEKLAFQGFNSVAFDSRTHGNSEGNHCTFGVKERKDVSELISFLEKEEKIIKNIGVWGRSLGGAIGLQAMGTDTRIKFGIIESTFTDFKTITNNYFEYNLGFNIPFFTNYLVCRAGKIAGFDTNDAKPITYCKQIDQPILMVHGTKDCRIDISYGKENFEKITSKNKQFLEIKNANHLNVWEVGGAPYFIKVFAFLNNTYEN